jgi:hypothetical protein
MQKVGEIYVPAAIPHPLLRRLMFTVAELFVVIMVQLFSSTRVKPVF